MTTTWKQTEYKNGVPYLYDQASMTYDGATFGGKPVYYDRLGTPTTWQFTNKS